MKWYRNLSIIGKIYFLFGLIAILLIAAFAYSYDDFRDIQTNQSTIRYKNYNALIEISKLSDEINLLRIDILTSLSKQDNSDSELLDNVKYKIGVLKVIAIKLSNLLDHKAEYRETINDLHMALEFYEKEELKNIELLAINDSREGVSLIESQGAEGLIYINSLTNKLKLDAQQELKQLLDDNNEKLSKLILSLLIIVTLFTLITLYSGYQSHKSIGEPINRLAKTAQKVSSGDLNIEIKELDRKDEIGLLHTAFHDMLKSFRELTMNITESSNNINASANQILTSTSELTLSAKKTADAIGDTTDSVNETKKATIHSNQKTLEVSERSQAAAVIAEKGRTASRETIDGINRIGMEMDSIGNNIIRLSEQSKAIGEIISTVNDIAEQSNLLAVNAAIEAARAGEQGKGFVIVAQEIKNLADQSKQATSQVKNILNEIQNSINASVLSAEQGSKSVEAGIRLAGLSGESIEELSQSIKLAAEASKQIEATSQEQEINIDQIASAMENIKEASDHNVYTTVQLDSSAKALQEISSTLRGLLEHFKV